MPLGQHLVKTAGAHSAPREAALDAYGTAFERVQRDAVGPAPITDLRRAAFDRFAQLGLPTTRLEQWRFTNVAPIATTTFSPAGPVSVAASAASPYITPVDGDAPTLVFVNGRYARELSTATDRPSGVRVESLADALMSDAAGDVERHLASVAAFDTEAFTALNTALLHDGAVVRVPDNVVVESPIQLLFLTVPPGDRAQVMTHPRVLIVAGDNAQASLVESYAGVGDGPYFTNTVTEVIAGAHSVIDHHKLVREHFDAFHIASMHLRLHRAASFSSHAITLGGGLVRNDIQAHLDGEGVECTLNGLYLANGRRLVDNHTTIHHAKPHGSSHELYKGIIDDQAHAVFNGKIIVAIDAQKTDAKQTNKALLLSEDAQINTKPELEIFADDVKCTHGATVGQLDDDALFYLRARGLGLAQARNVLIHAFASDLLNRIGIAPIRAMLDGLLLDQLPGSGGGAFYEQPD